MKLIAHRGNVYGPDNEKENSPDHILNAIDLGFDVEIDVWGKDNDLFLGHSEPQYDVDNSFIENFSDKFWVHCKNLEALYICNFLLKDINFFWHQEDDYALTSKKIFWTYPGKHLSTNSILVLPEKNNYEDLGGKFYGICSDYVLNIKEKLVNEYGIRF